MIDWQTMGAAALGKSIGDGRIDPVELADAFSEAIADHPLGTRIYVRTCPERARANAMAARERARAGARRGPLDGVPVSWKDLFDTAGVGTEAGTKLLEGRVPEADAAIVAAAGDNGLVSLGKTHLSELAFSGLGLNPVTETPPNIHDEGALAGGSSSGAAASVAHGLAPLAVGSDTAGSVRIPAAWNDLVGLKTTWGLLPNDGAVALCPRFDTAGPLARSVEDAAVALAALGRPAVDLNGASLKGARLVVLEGTVLSETDEGVAEAFEAAVDRLAAAGAHISRATLAPVEEVFELAALFAPEAYGTWREIIEANPSVMFPPILERFRSGAAMSAADYVAGWQRLERLRTAYLAVTEGFDAVLLPTCPILPPNAAHLLKDEAAYTRANLLALRNTRVGSLLGLAGLTLPTDRPSAGLLFQGGPRTEASLLRLGLAAERALA